MLKSLFRRAAAPVLAALALVAPAQAKAPQNARPALWEIADGDTTIYLFGTIHLLPENVQWQTTKFDQAVQGSQQLVVETIVDQKDPSKIMAAMSSLAFNTPNIPPLMSRVPAAKRPALAAAIKKSGYPPQAFDKLKSDEGVEAKLRDTFTTNGKPVGELETNIEQFGFFDRLPEKAQEDLLEGALDDSKSADEEFSGMLKAWAKGDVQGIARTFDRDLAGSPELEQALIHQRNANWSRWIEQRMGQPGVVMIAVGAGHLAGRESVVAMLKRDGYRVRRVQ
jgi:hypothetical protein